eukprot:TRINITY_DN4529_c0_g1_i1.p1 TRINITY_DN4529_c0_g1~~TRINITY_DN4529_c0_g1_i1.p1  ORF type:complete len:467 (-),score=84.35 TRINITY_DN4529_c0_g1_i1:18-1418(-)
MVSAAPAVQQFARKLPAMLAAHNLHVQLQQANTKPLSEISPFGENTHTLFECHRSDVVAQLSQTKKNSFQQLASQKMGQAEATPEKIEDRTDPDTYPSVEWTGPSTIKVAPTASKLSKKEIVNRIKGTIYGNCIGDAIGLATEFMSKEQASAIYKGQDLQYSMFRRDMHRRRWEVGDWTDDSDQMILILDGLFGNAGQVSPVDFAKRLKYWMRNGFPELGDLAGMGIGQTVHAVVNHPRFFDDPHQCAWQVWDKSKRVVAANGAVMRTSILGVVNFDDLEKVVNNTKAISLTTHADPRCSASCVAVTTAIALMLQKGTTKEDGTSAINDIVQQAVALAKKELDPKATDEKGFEEFERHAFAKSLQELQLDDKEKIGYTYKCFGSAFYCLRNEGDFRKLITELAYEGGDAATNAAVAGALLGCKVGYDALPKDWLEGLKHKAWLDKKVDRLIAMLDLDEEAAAAQLD